MKHSTGKPTKAQEERFRKLKLIRCIACRKHGLAGWECSLPEIHHLNVGGKAGQKRRGHDFTIPLGMWHHRGIPLPGWCDQAMEDWYGPSLAKSSKKFREKFGTDDELLAEVNQLIREGMLHI